MQNVFYYY